MNRATGRAGNRLPASFGPAGALSVVHALSEDDGRQ